MPIDIESTDIEVKDQVLVTGTSTSIAPTGDNIDIDYERREFSIVGDDVYIGTTMDETPQWLIDYIDNVNELLVNDKISKINALSQSLEDLLVALNIAKNAYTESIITYESLEELVNSKLETLNSSLGAVDSSIIDLVTTKVTATEASALANDVLSASIADGDISSIVSNLQSSIATEQSVRAADVNLVRAEIGGVDDAFSEAISTLESTVEAQDGVITGHSAQLTNLATGIGTGNWAGSGVNNSLSLAVGEIESRAESNFSYNSTLAINGVNYQSGFGLATSLTSGSGLTGSDSEFWIKADKFKLMSASGTTKSSYSPFSVDATTGAITFNGIVSFSNVTGSESLALKDMSNVTTIDGGKITTGTVDANVIKANTSMASPIINAGTINAGAISGGTISGGTISGVTISGSVIKSSWIDYSSTGDLTNWKSIKDISSVDSVYRGNFAKNNDGNYVVDSDGYYRLQGYNKVYSVIAGDSSGGGDGVYSYDYYKSSNTNRTLSLSPTMYVEEAQTIFSGTFNLSHASWASFNVLGNSLYIEAGRSGNSSSARYLKATVNGSQILYIYSDNNDYARGYFTIGNLSFTAVLGPSQMTVGLNKGNYLIESFSNSSYIFGNKQGYFFYSVYGSTVTGDASSYPLYYLTLY